MWRQHAIAAGLLVGLLSISSNATCTSIGTNFWSLSWGYSTPNYCTGGVWGNWSTTFINELQIYKVLRTMDWNSAYSAMATTWINRTQKSAGNVQTNDYTKAIAYEWQIDLVNKVPGCGWWLCVPVGADSTYVTNLAALTYSLLQPGRRVYLEYGNETWWEPNTQDYVSAAGNTLLTQYPALATINGASWGDPVFEKKFLGHAALACKMWHWFRKSWNNVGGDTTKVTRIMAGAFWANGADARYMLEALTTVQVNPYKEKCDMFACTDYFNPGNPTGTESGIRGYYGYCTVKGVALCCYEGGPSGTCTPAAMSQNLNMVNKYFNGPYCQYTHRGGQWGAIENGYYSALASWSAAQTCNPTLVQSPYQEPYRIVTPENSSAQVVNSLVNSSNRLYSVDGKRAGPQSVKTGIPGCYIVASPGKTGYNLLLNLK
jgi:hypothetical protein